MITYKLYYGTKSLGAFQDTEQLIIALDYIILNRVLSSPVMVVKHYSDIDTDEPNFLFKPEDDLLKYYDYRQSFIENKKTL